MTQRVWFSDTVYPEPIPKPRHNQLDLEFDRVVYGFTAVDIHGHRIDPLTLDPDLFGWMWDRFAVSVAPLVPPIDFQEV